jgi:hypothetical protein
MLQQHDRCKHKNVKPNTYQKNPNGHNAIHSHERCTIVVADKHSVANRHTRHTTTHDDLNSTKHTSRMAPSKQARAREQQSAMEGRAEAGCEMAGKEASSSSSLPLCCVVCV